MTFPSFIFYSIRCQLVPSKVSLFQPQRTTTGHSSASRMFLSKIETDNRDVFLFHRPLTNPLALASVVLCSIAPQECGFLYFKASSDVCVRSFCEVLGMIYPPPPPCCLPQLSARGDSKSPYSSGRRSSLRRELRPMTPPWEASPSPPLFFCWRPSSARCFVSSSRREFPC